MKRLSIPFLICNSFRSGKVFSRSIVQVDSTRVQHSILIRLRPFHLIALLVFVVIFAFLTLGAELSTRAVRAQKPQKNSDAQMEFGPAQKLAGGKRRTISPTDETNLAVVMSPQRGRERRWPQIPEARVPGSAAAYLVLSASSTASHH